MSRRLHATAWIALWALLVQLCLPLVHPAAALASGIVPDGPIVCTAQGLQIQADDGQPAAEPRCPECRGLVHLGFVPPVPQAPALSGGFSAIVFLVATAFAPAATPHSPLQARAPPELG